MIPNQEQLEAHQEKVSEIRRQRINQLSEEERNQFKAVSTAIDILTKAGVPAYIFPYLAGADTGKDIWQFNNFSAFFEFNENGLGYKKESQELLQRCNLLFFSYIMELFPEEIKQEKDINIYWNRVISLFIESSKFRMGEFKKKRNEV